MARQSDAQKLLPLVRKAHRQSRYKRLPFDETQCLDALRRHIGMGLPPSLGATAMFVTDDLSAALGAVCVPLYECLGAVLITDSFWYSQKTNARAGLAVLSAFHSWADQCATPHMVRQGVTDFISDSPERTGRVLERYGLRKVGAIYEKERIR